MKEGAASLWNGEEVEKVRLLFASSRLFHVI